MSKCEQVCVFKGLEHSLGGLGFSGEGGVPKPPKYVQQGPFYVSICLHIFCWGGGVQVEGSPKFFLKCKKIPYMVYGTVFNEGYWSCSGFDDSFVQRI